VHLRAEVPSLPSRGGRILALNLSHGWSRAGLRIYSDALDLEAVESALGLRATGKHLKGTPRSRDLKPIWPDSMWRFGTSLSNDHGLEGNLTLILDALEPKRDVIQGFAHEHRVDFFCGFSSGEREGGFTLTRVTLNRVAKFGVPLITNLSPPIPLEIDQEVAGASPNLRKWCAAAFRVIGEGLQRREIDTALDLRATHFHSSQWWRIPGGPSRQGSLWALHSPLTDEHGIAEHIRTLLGGYEPRMDPDFVADLEEIIGNRRPWNPPGSNPRL
jgi:Domain of unknown function (DUF4279)